MNECAVSWDANGELNVDLRGGAENGEFPYIGHIREDAVVYQDGKVCEGELLLEVNGLAVPGLPLYDIFGVINYSNGPVRLKTVRQGKKLDTKVITKLKNPDICSSVVAKMPTL